MNEAEAYINRIRNFRKRAYARAFWAWLHIGFSGPEPEPGQLSYMAAQAVRMRLYGLSHKSEDPQPAGS